MNCADEAPVCYCPRSNPPLRPEFSPRFKLTCPGGGGPCAVSNALPWAVLIGRVGCTKAAEVCITPLTILRSLTVCEGLANNLADEMWTVRILLEQLYSEHRRTSSQSSRHWEGTVEGRELHQK
jgi:hypothetical protein